MPPLSSYTGRLSSSSSLSILGICSESHNLKFISRKPYQLPRPTLLYRWGHRGPAKASGRLWVTWEMNNWAGMGTQASCCRPPPGPDTNAKSVASPLLSRLFWDIRTLRWTPEITIFCSYYLPPTCTCLGAGFPWTNLSLSTLRLCQMLNREPCVSQVCGWLLRVMLGGAKRLLPRPEIPCIGVIPLDLFVFSEELLSIC